MKGEHTLFRTNSTEQMKSLWDLLDSGGKIISAVSLGDCVEYIVYKQKKSKTEGDITKPEPIEKIKAEKEAQEQKKMSTEYILNNLDKE